MRAHLMNKWLIGVTAFHLLLCINCASLYDQQRYLIPWSYQCNKSKEGMPELSNEDISDFLKEFNQGGECNDQMKASFAKWASKLENSLMSKNMVRTLRSFEIPGPHIITTGSRGQVFLGIIATTNYTLYWDFNLDGTTCSVVLDEITTNPKKVADICDIKAFLRHVNWNDKFAGERKAFWAFGVGSHVDTAYKELFAPYKSGENEVTITYTFGGERKGYWQGICNCAIEIRKADNVVISSRCGCVDV
jgi:hypothetical protein